MRKAIIPAFLFLFFSGLLWAQDCVRSPWAKSLGGNSSYNSIIDGERTPGGNFVVAGTFGASNLTLDTITLAASGSYHYFLAEHDSAGHIIRAKVFATGNGSDLIINNIDVGHDGNVHITGYWEGAPVFEGDTLPLASRKRVFAASFSPVFELRWIRGSAWMSADCKAFDVTSDLNGNVFVAGTFEDNAFRIGDSVALNSGGWNMWSDEAFLIKFDSSGFVQFVRSFGSTADEAAYTITADSSGNVVITGVTTKTNAMLYFDEKVMVPGGLSNWNMFLAKFSGLDGRCLWGRVAGGLSTYDYISPMDACLGEDNSFFVAGTLSGTVQVFPKSYVCSDNDAFLAKFDSEGNNLWLHLTGGQGTSEFAVSCSYYGGKVAVIGKLFSNQPYAGSFPLYCLVSNATFDAFNSMYTTSGELIWARANDAGSNSDIYPSAVFIDNGGNQLYWGSFRNTQSFYPLALTAVSGNPNLFLVKFSTFSGNPAFTVSAGPDKITACGVNVQLNGSTSPANIPFGWSPSLGFTSNGSSNPYVSPAAPTHYVLFSSYQGCVKKDSVYVDLSNYNNLAVYLPPSIELCYGDSVQLQSATNQPSASFTWTPASYINTASVQNPWVKPPLAANYIVAVDYNGCKAYDTVAVHTRNKPGINIPRHDFYNYWRAHFCQGAQVDIDLGDPANIYTITTPAVVTNVNNNLVTILTDSLGADFLKVNAVNNFGCTAKDSVMVAIHQNQPAPLIMGSVPDRSACPGDSIEIYVMLTNSIQYNFQYSWYAGWQVDSMNGQGWKDISKWEKKYDIFLYSVGYPNSTYYIRLRIPVIHADMDGFRYRCYVKDYCSPPAYSNAGNLRIGPKVTAQPISKVLCQGVTDSINVNSSLPTASYTWEILQGGSYVPVVNQPGVIASNGRFLRFENVQPGFDSTWVRCRLEGCGSILPVYSNPALIRVIAQPVLQWQTPSHTVCENIPDSFNVVVNSGPYTFNWYRNNAAITYNTSNVQGYNTPRLKFTPVYLAENNNWYKCRISNQQCGFNMFSDSVRFFVTPFAGVSWAGNMITTCVNAVPMALAGGTPPGGTYSGPGVVNNVFYPQQAGVGPHILSYTYYDSISGCGGTRMRSFMVNGLPAVSWPGGSVSFCQSDPPWHLQGGTPANGSYSGTGISGPYFSPSNAGPGTFQLFYIYTNPTTGCTDTASRTVIVNSDPSVSWPGGQVNYCLSDGLDSLTGGQPAGGTYSGQGVTGNMFSPQLAGLGSHLITYTFIDPVTNCESSASRVFFVDPCTGIKEMEQEAPSVFHSGDGLLIDWKTSFNEPLQISVFNMLGQILYQGVAAAGTNSFIIPEQYISGFIIIRLEYPGRSLRIRHICTN